MITEDPQLETRLRHYGTVLRDEIQVAPTLHSQIIGRVLRTEPVRSHRPVVQLIAAAAIVLVAIGAVGLLLRVRADELAKAAPHVTSVSPADGATGVALTGQFRVTFARRPSTLPSVAHEPPDGTQAAAQWQGMTLVVKYSGLHSHTRYGVVVSNDYTSSLGGTGHFEQHWSFITEFGPPPSGVPLIWYSTSPRFGPSPQAMTQIALDWNGTVVGTLHTAGGINQSPDGSRLDLAGVGFTDQAGQQVAPILSSKGGPGWADDSRHICRLGDANDGIPTGDNQPGWLFAGPLEGPLKRIAQAGQFGGQSGPQIVACSILSDRAVVVEYGPTTATELRVFALSTGVLIYQHQYPSGQVASSVVASHDGRYLAEATVSFDAQGRQISGDSVIRRTSDGAVLARLTGQAVVAFSWDGSRVITMPAFGSVDFHEVRLVDWQRGQTLWRLAEPAGVTPGFAYVSVLARPGGGDLVVGVARDGTGESPVDQLWLVHPDGAATQVAKGPIFPDF